MSESSQTTNVSGPGAPEVGEAPRPGGVWPRDGRRGRGTRGWRRHAAAALLAAIAVSLGVAVPAAAADPPARTALDEYVARPDPSYAWEHVRTTPLPGGRVSVLSLTSQTWRSGTEVDRPQWKHWVTVVVPEKVRSDTALLLIGGGRNGRDAPRRPDGNVLGVAAATGIVAVELGQVPNEPLTFRDDGRPRVEDDLIAYTWNKFMDTGDPMWAARLPMVKSAVRAMDAAQAFLKTEAGGKVSISKFIVAGGSKRGWTTWLTGAVDPRVISIVPIVIDVLNVVPSMEHHHAAYGFWAPAVGDYERNGIMDRRQDPRYRKLLDLVDPYSYRHRLKMPKFLINSAGDQFFLPDSSQFYFDDLEGEKYLRYVPNTDHSLKGSDAAGSLQAWAQAIISNTPRPRFSWKFAADGSIRVRAETAPLEVLLWQATNPEARDFRLESIGPAWKSAPLEAHDGVWTARVDKPEKGWTAFFVALAFPGPGPNPFQFTTAVRVVPDRLPFPVEAGAESGGGGDGK